MIVMTEYNKIHDRAYIGSAMSDVQLLRKALSMYDAEWGTFPTTQAGNLMALIAQLNDPTGQPYINPPSGDNFRSFLYSPPDLGEEYGDYSLTVVANDHGNTQITVHWNQSIEIVRLN